MEPLIEKLLIVLYDNLVLHLPKFLFFIDCSIKLEHCLHFFPIVLSETYYIIGIYVEIPGYSNNYSI